jgi:2',3'-cyclic-nucleotide 2'-phosphodiesterase (5'-nucleotidase family)
MAITVHNYIWETKTYVAETKYSGRVLKKWVNNNYQIMSDVWGSADMALVLDENNEPKTCTVQVYDGPTDPNAPRNTVEVDATEDVRKSYRDYLVKRHYEYLVNTEKDRNSEIQKGVIAKVVKGRNGQGTVGKVVVQMDAPYRMGYRSSIRRKIAIATSDVKIKKPLTSGRVMEVYRDVVWAWAFNCERVDTPEINQHMCWLDAERYADSQIAGL